MIERIGGRAVRSREVSVCLPFFFSSRRRHTRCSRDWSSDVCSSDLQTLRQELKLYNPELAKKPYAVAATKLDIAGDGKNLKKLQTYCQKRGWRFFPISAVASVGLKPLMRHLGSQVAKLRQPLKASV